MDEEQIIIAPSAQTCPECGGAMREENIGRLTHFRCHTGHMMTAEVLAAAQAEELDQNLARYLRLLNERAGLCRDMAQKCDKAGDTRAAEVWRRAGDEAARREETAKTLTALDWQHPEGCKAGE
jgi:two-component system chemotaxis response regulator CheB